MHICVWLYLSYQLLTPVACYVPRSNSLLQVLRTRISKQGVSPSRRLHRSHRTLSALLQAQSHPNAMPASSSSISELHAQRNRFWSTVLHPSDASSRNSDGMLMGARCGQCGAMFRCTTDLAAHVKLSHHHRNRMFVCDHCKMQFSQSSHLKQHIRAVHELLRPFQCVKCERPFGKRFDVESHFRAVHENYRPHICPVPDCARPFSKRSNCKRHVTKIHPTHLPHNKRTSNKTVASSAATSSSKRQRRGRLVAQ